MQARAQTGGKVFKLAFDASHEGAKLSVGQERRTREFTTGHGALAARQPQGTGWCSGILQPADSVAPRAEAQRAPTAPRQSGLFVCHGVLKYRSIFGDSLEGMSRRPRFARRGPAKAESVPWSYELHDYAFYPETIEADEPLEELALG